MWSLIPYFYCDQELSSRGRNEPNAQTLGFGDSLYLSQYELWSTNLYAHCKPPLTNIAPNTFGMIPIATVPHIRVVLPFRCALIEYLA